MRWFLNKGLIRSWRLGETDDLARECGVGYGLYELRRWTIRVGRGACLDCKTMFRLPYISNVNVEPTLIIPLVS